MGTWKEDIPDTTGGTLRELGYTTKSLVECSEHIASLLRQVDQFAEITKESAKAKNDAIDKSSPGIWNKIKRWFTESKAEKEERLEKENILANKHYAIMQLMWGFRQTMMVIGTMMYKASLKVEHLISKSSK